MSFVQCFRPSVAEGDGEGDGEDGADGEDGEDGEDDGSNWNFARKASSVPWFVWPSKDPPVKPAT